MAYLKGLLSAKERKNSWTLSERAGRAMPDRMQRLFLTTDWDPGALRDDLRSYVVKHLGATDGIKGGNDPQAEHWLPTRRSLADPEDTTHWICHVPKRVGLAKLVRVAGAQGAIDHPPKLPWPVH